VTDSSCPLTHQVPVPPDDSVCVRFGFSRCALGLVEVLQAGVMVLDGDGVIAYLNRAGADILGVDADAVIGREISSAGLDFDHLREIGSSGGRWGKRSEIRLSRNTNQSWIGFKMTIIEDMLKDVEGNQYVLIFQNIDESIRLRKERDRFLRMATVSRILPTIAHEIKNPLAGIKALSDVLLDELGDPRQREDVEAIRTEVERLRLIVDGLGMADGALLDGRENINPEEEIRTVLRLVAPKAANLGIRVEKQLQGGLSLPLNRSLFRVVLINLLNNAMEACSAGDRVQIRCEHREPEEFRLVIEDSGTGMSPETLEQATEFFFTTKETGSGIGLALIEQVVRKSGGRLFIDSREGAGTRVEIRLDGGNEAE